MDPSRPAVSGLWLPLITPFRDGKLDGTSLQRLVAHLLAACLRLKVLVTSRAPLFP